MCAPGTAFYFQHGANLPSNKRQTSRHAGCARAVLAHLRQRSPACFGGRKFGASRANGDLRVAGRAFGLPPAWTWWHSRASRSCTAPVLPVSCRLPWHLRSACTCAGEGYWGFFRHSPGERGLAGAEVSRVPKKVFLSQNGGNKPGGESWKGKEVLVFWK